MCICTSSLSILNIYSMGRTNSHQAKKLLKLTSSPFLKSVSLYGSYCSFMLVLLAMILSVLFTFPFSAPLSWWQRNPCTNKCWNVNKIRQRNRIFQRIEGVFTSLATSLHFKSVFVLQMWSKDNIENMSWKLRPLSNALLKIVEMSCWEKT